MEILQSHNPEYKYVLYFLSVSNAKLSHEIHWLIFSQAGHTRCIRLIYLRILS